VPRQIGTVVGMHGVVREVRCGGKFMMVLWGRYQDNVDVVSLEGGSMIELGASSLGGTCMSRIP